MRKVQKLLDQHETAPTGAMLHTRCTVSFSSNVNVIDRVPFKGLRQFLGLLKKKIRTQRRNRRITMRNLRWNIGTKSRARCSRLPVKVNVLGGAEMYQEPRIESRFDIFAYGKYILTVSSNLPSSDTTDESSSQGG